MLKNTRVFIAFRVFLYPGRKVATSFANITGIPTRTRKLVNSHGFSKSKYKMATRMKEHTESDKNSHIFKHFNTSPLCKSKYSTSCFRILDSASNSIDLKLKEAFYINKIKPERNNCSITTLFSRFSLHLDVWCHAVNSTRFCITSCCNNFFIYP